MAITVGFVGMAAGRVVSICAIVRSGRRVGSLLAGHASVIPAAGLWRSHHARGLAEMQRRTGLERIVLQSTEAGYALYRRMGFRDATRFSVYLTK